VAAERHGFYDFDAPDHVLLSDDHGAYPAGAWRWETDSMWPDPLIVLAGAAAATSRIHLTTSILVMPLRPAVVIAKMSATLDNLSGGRLRLGVGSGWLRAEFDAVEVPYVGRTKRLEDSIAACRALWTESPATFASETVSFTSAYCYPKPARAAGIPVLIGGPPTPVHAERVARLAEGWNPMDVHAEGLAEGIGHLRDAFTAIGRDPGSAVIRFPAYEDVVRDAFERDDPAALAEHVAELGELGVTDVKIYLAGVVRAADEVDDALGWLSRALSIDPDHRTGGGTP
jgi:probable F420-dependent oxidoreductase